MNSLLLQQRFSTFYAIAFIATLSHTGVCVSALRKEDFSMDLRIIWLFVRLVRALALSETAGAKGLSVLLRAFVVDPKTGANPFLGMNSEAQCLALAPHATSLLKDLCDGALAEVDKRINFVESLLAGIPNRPSVLQYLKAKRTAITLSLQAAYRWKDAAGSADCLALVRQQGTPEEETGLLGERLAVTGCDWRKILIQACCGPNCLSLEQTNVSQAETTLHVNQTVAVKAEGEALHAWALVSQADLTTSSLNNPS